MAGLDDLLARSQAAGGMAGAMPEADPMALPSPTPETEPGMEAPDVEQGLSIVEGYAESVDPSTGDQIREHVNAIRELTANAAPMEAVPPAEEPLPEEGMPPTEEPLP